MKPRANRRLQSRISAMRNIPGGISLRIGTSLSLSMHGRVPTRNVHGRRKKG